MANMMVVPLGTAPGTLEPRVLARLAKAGGTAGMRAGLRNVRKIVFVPFTYVDAQMCVVSSRQEALEESSVLARIQGCHPHA